MKTLNSMRDRLFVFGRGMILMLALIVVGASQVKASHGVGGELTWRAVPSLSNPGTCDYVFRVVLYRDCSGTTYTRGMTINIKCGNLPAPWNTSGYIANFVGAVDMSNECRFTSSAKSCNGDPVAGNGQLGAVGKLIFETQPINITQTAPAAGFTFYTDNIPCCRNTNQNSSGCSNMYLRAIMYPFVAGMALPANLAWDDSPQFSEPPIAAKVANASSVDTIFYNNNALDLNLDQLTYFIANPWNGLNTPCAYTGGYSVNNPMPNIVMRPNGKPIDSLTGEMVYVARTQGNYLITIGVKSYRCGQLVAEIFRDFQTMIIAPAGLGPNYDPANQAPQVSAPFSVNGQPSYSGAYYVGDTISFNLAAVDFVPFGDSVNLSYNGAIFGAYNQATQTMSTTSGCIFPPCAVVQGIGAINNQYAKPMIQRGDTVGIGFKRFATVGTKFIWYTDCNNLSGANRTQRIGCFTSGQFSVTVTASDDQCPFNGKTIKTINFQLYPKPQIPAPPISCVDISTGAFRMNLGSIIDTVTLMPLDTLKRQSIVRRAKSLKAVYLYRSVNFGAFTMIDSIVVPNGMNHPDSILAFLNTHSFFVDNNVSCGNNNRYFMRTTSGCDLTLSAPGDTVGVMNLTVTNSPTGVAILNWSPFALGNVFPNPNAAYYVIERRVKGSTVWDSVGVSTTNSYNDPVVVCDDTVYYRVKVAGRFGCNTYSCVSSDRFKDIFPPAQMNIVGISVDTTSANQNIVIRGDVTSALDFKQYEFYVTNPNRLIGTSTIRTVPMFVDNVNSGSASQFTYTVVAQDSCLNKSPLSNPLSNIYLQQSLDKCNATINLSWNDISAWYGGLKEYRVMRASGTSWNQIGTVAAGATTFADNNGLVDGTTYSYAIWAVNNTDTTLIVNSNQVSVVADIVRPASDLYLRSVSVNLNTQFPEVTWIIDTLAEVKSFNIERNQSGSWVVVGNVSATTISKTFDKYNQYVYTDNSAEVSTTSYRYRVKPVDLCDRTPQVTNEGLNILLTGRGLSDFTNNLSWNEYLQWDATVGGYNVLRSIPIVSASYNQASTLASTARTYTDNVFLLDDNDGNFCYVIQAYEKGTNKYGLTDTAMSNKLCVSQDPRLYVPNVVVPYGINNIFQPKGTYINKTDGYRMAVYNRWGEMVFETTDFNKGWDGMNKGQMVIPGQYVYVINFKDAAGRVLSRKGMVQVVD